MVLKEPLVSWWGDGGGGEGSRGSVVQTFHQPKKGQTKTKSGWLALAAAECRRRTAVLLTSALIKCMRHLWTVVYTFRRL